MKQRPALVPQASQAPGRDPAAYARPIEALPGRHSRRMSIRNLTIEGGKLAADVAAMGDVFTLEYAFPFDVHVPDAAGLVAACLVPAMGAKLNLAIAGDISPALASSTVTVQQILHSWFPRLAMVEIHARPTLRPLPAGQGKVACFFTGGVDSFYSVLKHRDEIDELVFIPEFELSLNTPELRARISGALTSAAHEMHLPLIEVESNLRRFADPLASWDAYHGAALASVALLAGRYSKVFVPSTHPYQDLIPYGSHPLLDPLWSTENTAIVHDGAEATRPEKIATLASHEVAMRWLRVCWENTHGAYNCGRCEKCLRTMIALDLVGALGKAQTFAPNLNLLQVARMRVPAPDKTTFIRENIKEIRRRKSRLALTLTLESVLLRCRTRSLLGLVKRWVAGRLKIT